MATLLEEIKQTNLELEKKDGIKRHFRYDYQEIGKYNREYLNNVESECRRIGENHPLFLTQYRLLPVHGGGGFLNSTQKAQFQGGHSRLREPQFQNSKIYVAGIDLAGQAESGQDDFLRSLKPRHDSTGVGEPVAAFLQGALGHRVVPFKFTAQSKTALGFNLLAAINSGRLKMYSGDGSPEYQELLFELNKAKSLYRPDRTFNFFVDPSDGHDDFLMSLALLVESASLYEPRSARGKT
jgi:hypothetical protein